ncbi:lipopolysaccharide biosynthesis protein [bacterium c-19]|nr:lipopolysaccharide biosynthesis protein [bacterium c-19]
MKRFLLISKDIKKDSYLWNMLGSMLTAFQSVIMLMILTRTLGLTDAGIFTIAYANANLFLTIGKYGMRYYQVSDVKHQFSFKEYKASRIVSCIAMILISALYILITGSQNNYSAEKSLIILCMCVFKMIDAIEDVYIAMYQQEGRLDVGSKVMTVRIFFTLCVFSFSLLLLKNLLNALIVSTVFTIICLILLLFLTNQPFKKQERNLRFQNVSYLLRVCFPLCISAFLSFYIGNAPKYAIDAQLNDTLQACYGFISMPVFVIGLLNNFIFNPIITKMSILWSHKCYKEFIKKVAFQVLVIAAITLICVIGAYLLGVPVLSILYNTDLSDYKTELIVLLVGGGFLGLSGFLTTVITIMRIQRTLILGYGSVAVLAYFLSPILVANYEMMGAAYGYLLLMILLSGFFVLIASLKIRLKLKELSVKV